MGIILRIDNRYIEDIRAGVPEYLKWQITDAYGMDYHYLRAQQTYCVFLNYARGKGENIKAQGAIYIMVYRAPKFILFADEQYKGSYFNR